MPKIIIFGADVTKLWQKIVGSFFGTPCIYASRHVIMLFAMQFVYVVSALLELCADIVDNNKMCLFFSFHRSFVLHILSADCVDVFVLRALLYGGEYFYIWCESSRHITDHVNELIVVYIVILSVMYCTQRAHIIGSYYEQISFASACFVLLPLACIFTIALHHVTIKKKQVKLFL